MGRTIRSSGWSLEAVSILPALVWHYGEPMADQAAIPTLYLSELTRRHVTVALNGDGGDENFAGYHHHLAALRLNRLSVFPSSVARLLAKPLNRMGPGLRNDSFRSRARRAANRLSIASPAERYESVVAFNTDRDLAELYTPEFRAELGPERIAHHVVRDPYLASDSGGPARQDARHRRQQPSARRLSGQGGHRIHGVRA